MNQSDYDNFVDVMQLVSEQYGKKPSPGLIALYWQGLRDFELAAVRDALGRHLRNTDTGQFMPKIADIIRMLQGSALDSALSAWTIVDKAVRQVGLYQTVVFDDAITMRVLHDMGGWIGLGQKTEDEWPFIARDFENRYRGFKSRNERTQHPAKLAGLSELSCVGGTFSTPAPILIGNPEKAREVMEVGKNAETMLQITRPSDLIGIGEMLKAKQVGA